MIFIYGGAYQGKLDFARERFGVTDGGVQNFLDGTEIDAAKKCLNGYHMLVLSQLRAGIDPLEYISSNMGLFEDKIIICDDISSGVVPLGEENRRWREAAGRAAVLLSSRADEVWRIFCGVGTRLK